MLRRASSILKNFTKISKMSDLLPATNEIVPKTEIQVTEIQAEDAKRRLDNQQEGELKKQKTEDPGPMQGRLDRKRKVALMMIYSGKGYYGVQTLKKAAELPTIEDELLTALLKLGVIDEDAFDCPQKMQFQRAARTDKGVSAAGQLFSLKIKNLIEKINENIPKQMKVVAIRRVTKGFNAKNNCCGRTYIYMTPTYVFAPIEKFITEEYRTEDQIIQKINEVLQHFVGTHNFHNFTSGLKPTDPSAKRYIISFECGQPFVRDGMEFVILKVRGQSFVMHHIRKMVGLTIAIVRGFCGLEVIKKSWDPEKVDIPKAPGTGLLLEKLHFDRYNQLYGKDGMHEPIDWTVYKEEIETFKEEHILNEIVKAEKDERVMFHWLSTLHNHKFDVQTNDIHESWVARRQMKNLLSNKDEKNSEESKDSTDTETTSNTAERPGEGDAKGTSNSSVKVSLDVENLEVAMETHDDIPVQKSQDCVSKNDETPVVCSSVSTNSVKDCDNNGNGNSEHHSTDSSPCESNNVENIAEGQQT